MLIGLDDLIDKGLIQKEDLKPVPNFSKSKIDFEKLIKWKMPILSKAVSAFLKSEKIELQKYEKFCEENFLA